ncbi:hypothetical protein BDU57DRAFT_547287 [Ampelomyces quisqualis]|uniref:USP domain-containing protein n=1 Tax=Ampelomyces quisqualis TaxID=50730 RepID=A0A6A5QS56_AMPQU|nr:hypothetical protein BDU57DRAFT_547287 [Ampelomyces quisqualis]
MPPRNSVTSAAAAFMLKSNLQRQRDNYGFKISKKWLPRGARPNRRPRGFQSTNGPLGHARQRCYQNVVHQALMHTPIFVRWIMSHNKPEQDDHDADNCVMCSYKSLAQRYWTGVAPVITPFPHNDPAVLQIANAAAIANPVAFGQGPGEAAFFYEWVTDQMQYHVPITGFPPGETQNQHWNEEQAALFRLDYHREQTCRSCLRLEEADEHTDLMDVPIIPTMRLQDILDHEFFREESYSYCVACHRYEMHNVQRKINAAPQVLRIHVNLLQMNNGHLIKNMQGWDVDRTLDLRTFQLQTGLPLDYQLSSAIAHGGNSAYSIPIVPLQGGVVNEGGEYENIGARSGEEEEEADDQAPIPEEEPEENADIYARNGLVEGGFSRNSQTPSNEDPDRRNNMGDFDGLVEVTQAEFINELDPGLSHLPSDSLMLEAEDEDRSALNRHYSPSISSVEDEEEDEEDDSEATISIADSDDHIGYLFQVTHHNNNNVAAEVAEEGGRSQGHYLLNVQGPDDCSHVSEDHSRLLADNLLTANPQRPTDGMCHIARGYQVVVLTYIRKSLTGQAAKLERDLIPPW